ncbi:MAG: DUF924 domain-containing protein [Proteobacteria bacterium]|nr:DUF924 domain-containing protein [Pseudomonadota bacterium]
MPEPAWVGDVIRFWLEETPPEARFKRSDGLDAAIRQRFGALYEQIAATPPAASTLTPRSAVAAVIVLDQFSRNMYRGEPRAFAADATARAIASAAVEAGLDRDLDTDGRLFLYLPFEHSENLADQDRSVALIEALGDANYTRYAHAHREIISRFGRFPHRNDVLGRLSSAEEIEFLKQPGSSF